MPDLELQPQRAGVYWVCCLDSTGERGSPRIAEVFDSWQVEFIGLEQNYHVNPTKTTDFWYVRGLWYGPITPPSLFLQEQQGVQDEV